MGEVYRARDARLGRDVALKVLPAEVATDPARRQRFEIEARAIAALNHPNIVAVYDVGNERGVLYIVTELVDGETLVGAKAGLRKTIEIAVQIASGLAAAHEAGIVHRDLKPSNIVLARDGRVKILDFGVAKVSPAIAAGAALTETITVNTQPGAMMGTVGYMSPEQVLGQAVDHRSDIFSFGIILNELLTGKRAFQGATSVDTMQAILRQDPPVLPETVPVPVRQIVQHCLEKEPGNRFQSARDLAFALSAYSQSSSQSDLTTVLPAGRWGRRWRWSLLALPVAAALGALAGGYWLRPAAPLSYTGMLLGGPEVTMCPRLSPDGHTLAFQAMLEGLTQVAVMRPETGDWTALTHQRERGFVLEMSWSADGSRIYYDRVTDVPRGIFSVPVLGGAEHLVLEDAMWPQALPDGSLLVTRLNADRRQQLYHFWPESGRLEAIALLTPNFYATVRASSDGKRAFALGHPAGGGQAAQHLYAIELASGSVRQLATGLPNDSAMQALAVTRDGKGLLLSLVAGNMGKVARLPLDSSGPAHTLLTVSGHPEYIDGGPDESVYVDEHTTAMNSLRIQPANGRAQREATIPVAELPAPFHAAVLSDGREVFAKYAGGRSRLMVFDGTKEAAPLVNTTEETAGPVAPVGESEVAFLVGPEPRRTIALATVRNGRITRRIGFDHGTINSLAATPDGKLLLCSAGGAVWQIPLAGGEPKRLRAGNAIALDAAGQNLFVQVIESPRTRLVRVPLQGGAEQEVPVQEPFHLSTNMIGPNAVGRNGQLLAPMLSPDAWSSPPYLVDLATGKVKRLPVEGFDFADYRFLGWGRDGEIVAAAFELRSAIWKFAPEKR
jgi:predicted Ser/Thr protein kinase